MNAGLLNHQPYYIDVTCGSPWKPLEPTQGSTRTCCWQVGVGFVGGSRGGSTWWILCLAVDFQLMSKRWNLSDSADGWLTSMADFFADWGVFTVVLWSSACCLLIVDCWWWWRRWQHHDRPAANDPVQVEPRGGKDPLVGRVFHGFLLLKV